MRFHHHYYYDLIPRGIFSSTIVCCMIIVNIIMMITIVPPPSVLVVNAIKFQFAAVGENPYSDTGREAFVDIMNEMNENPLEFIVHVGGIKSGESLCTDEILEDRKTLFDETSKHPFIYVPGDNEWTDCHRRSCGSYNPIERLDTIRRMFFSTSQSLGKRRMNVVRQSDVTNEPNFEPYRENAVWIRGGIVFVTLNIPGSNNGQGQGVQSLDEEFPIRNAANLEWLNVAFDFAQATNAPAVAVFLQGNAIQYFLPTPNQTPDKDGIGNFPLCVPLQGTTTGYDDFLLTLRALAHRLNKPVLLVHGDTHTNRVDKPYTGQVGMMFGLDTDDGGLGDGLTALPNVTRLETFGDPVVGWTKVIVNTNRPTVFTFEEGGSKHYSSNIHY